MQMGNFIDLALYPTGCARQEAVNNSSKATKKKNVLFPETWNGFHGSVGRIFFFFSTSKHVFFSHN